jgi:hypothetical protein
MKLRDVVEGTRAIKRVPLPLVNRPCSLSPDIPELAAQRATDDAAAVAAGGAQAPESVDVGLRVLTAMELATVYEKAGEFARSKGVDKPNDEDPIYNLGVSVYLCAIACVDPDTDPRDPDPQFGERGDIESAALELLSSPHVGREGLQYLAHAQELWQDMCSPAALRVSPLGLVEACKKLGSSDTEEAYLTFLRLRPGMQWHSARFMASQLALLQTLKSSSGFMPPDTNSSGSRGAGSEPS